MLRTGLSGDGYWNTERKIAGMIKKIIFATGNQNKMREIREIMGNLPVEILSMKEAGIKADIEEDGTTFEENAVIKAKAVADLLPEKDKEAIVLADDSGLEIDALNGEPGIYSARYMGEDTSYHIKNAELIRRLEGVPVEKRTARFVCAVAAVLPDRTCLTVRGTIEGRIGYEERGSNGFGYDPIFMLPDMSCTTAELPPEEKNRISHRGKALRLMEEKLRGIL
jgi:XTP/dITP diphosphohydrolase